MAGFEGCLRRLIIGFTRAKAGTLGNLLASPKRGGGGPPQKTIHFHYWKVPLIILNLNCSTVTRRGSVKEAGHPRRQTRERRLTLPLLPESFLYSPCHYEGMQTPRSECL